MKRYNIYATLLDAFQRYLDAERLWEQYFSEKYTLSYFEQLSKQELIDRINRKPFESEAADKGTAFNELVDILAHGNTSDKIEYQEKEFFAVIYKNEKLFTFDKEITFKIVDKVKGAIPQYFCSADLKVNDNTVNLYGYIDELKEFSIIDIKTTAKYSAFKFRTNWQHIVYPYCLNKIGINVNNFEYLIVELSKNPKIYREIYNYKEEKETLLIDICGRLIEFLEANKDLITDRKIFNI
jgi:hypothetical protein